MLGQPIIPFGKKEEVGRGGKLAERAEYHTKIHLYISSIDGIYVVSCPIR